MDQIVNIPLRDINVIENTRASVKETNIDELMQSMKQHGLKQPIGVSKTDKNGSYNLIFGNRRLLAAEKLLWKTIPAIVTADVDIKKLLVLNITENIQRKDPSFIEYARVIQKLCDEMKMNLAEVAAVLSITEDKVNQITNAYRKLPAKHHAKIAFAGKGQRIGKGGIPLQIANQVVRIKKDQGLDAKNTDMLIKYITETQMSKEEIKNLSMLLQQGLTIEDAIEKLHQYHVYHLEIVVDRALVVKHMNAHGATGAANMFRKIIYGKIPSIKKPDFINV